MIKAEVCNSLARLDCETGRCPPNKSEQKQDSIKGRYKEVCLEVTARFNCIAPSGQLLVSSEDVTK